MPLAAWGIGRYVAKRVANPIDRLRRGVERVGRGDLDYKVARGEKDEVGELAEAFNRMTGQLVSGRHELETAHEDLGKAYAENEERRRAETMSAKGLT